MKRLLIWDSGVLRLSKHGERAVGAQNRGSIRERSMESNNAIESCIGIQQGKAGGTRDIKRSNPQGDGSLVLAG